MASYYPIPSRKGITLPESRRYTVAELLMMGRTLPFICCPVASFKPVAWTENILTTVTATNNPNSQMIATKLGTHRPRNLISRNYEQEAAELNALRRNTSSNRISPNPRVLATIYEAPTAKSITKTAKPRMQPLTLDYGLSGGYGKNIRPEGHQMSNIGLTTSMHAFVPGGTLKSPPVTALNALHPNTWEMGDNNPEYRANTLSLADGLGLQRDSTHVAITPKPFAPASTSGNRRSPQDNGKGKENARMSHEPNSAARNNLGLTTGLYGGTSIPTPRNLMHERPSGEEQRAWIEYMLAMPVLSASRSGPQIKEPLGASVDEDFDEDDHHEVLENAYYEGMAGGDSG